MTPFRWVLLCLLFTLYLLLGGSIFMLIEQHHEIHQKEELHVLRQDIQEILFRLDRNFYDNTTNPDILDALTSAKEGVINRIAQVCQLDNLLEGPDTTTLKWNYYNSVFFAFTVVTTIGYGHLSPSTSLSKSLMMVYALFGIPLNGILLSGVGDYFSNKLVKVHQKSKDKKYRGKSLTLIFEIIFYLIPGIVVFIIIPAGIFVLIENWSFLDSIYFAFVSLTTIGFGDYVAGMGDGHNIWLWLYKAFIIIWITFGLGYLIMILGFIAKGMKSKKVRGILDKRLSGIRNTKEKLSKDIDYMRRIVNELYMMKLKPAYEINGEEVKDDPSMEKIGDLNGWVRTRRPFERRCSSLPRLSECEGEDNAALEIGDDEHRPAPSSSGAPPQKRKGILKRRLSDSDIRWVNPDPSLSQERKDSMTAEEMLESVVIALNGNMQNVINAVDELNKYEQQVENERDFGDGESPEDSDHDEAKRNQSDCESASGEVQQKEVSGATPTWDIRIVSESDEEVLIDGDQAKADPLDSVVVIHKSSKDETDCKSPVQSFMEKVSDAIRKISGSGTPPGTPPRKISRNESERKRKISRGISEIAPGLARHHYQYSPFTRRPSTSRRPHSTLETDSSKHSSQFQDSHSSDLRKISQESRVSSLSTGSYQTVDEIISSARATRKNTPAHYHPSSPLPPGDELDGSMSTTTGRLSMESSTSSLVHFLKALDNVQDRLKKTSDVSFSGSYMSDSHGSDGYDLSSSFAPSSRVKPIGGRYQFKRSVEPVQGVDRRRKTGIFQPGFSYVNFGYSPEDDDDEEENDDVPPSVVVIDGVVGRGKGGKSEDGSDTCKKR